MDWFFRAFNSTRIYETFLKSFSDWFESAGLFVSKTELGARRHNLLFAEILATWRLSSFLWLHCVDKYHWWASWHDVLASCEANR